MGRAEWSGARKAKESTTNSVKMDECERKYESMEIQTDRIESSDPNEPLNDVDNLGTTEELTNAEEGDTEGNLTFADELRKEVRDAVQGVMQETRNR